MRFAPLASRRDPQRAPNIDLIPRNEHQARLVFLDHHPICHGGDVFMNITVVAIQSLGQCIYGKRA